MKKIERKVCNNFTFPLHLFEICLVYSIMYSEQRKYQHMPTLCFKWFARECAILILGEQVMKKRVTLPSWTLRTKLVLSYLGVTLGAILILSIVITQVVQYNFAHQQQDEFGDSIKNDAQQIGVIYHETSGNWDNVQNSLGSTSTLNSNIHPGPPHQDSYSDSIELIANTNTILFGLGDLHSGLVPLIAENQSIVNQCVNQAVQGQTVQNPLRGSVDGGPSISAYYVCKPIYDNGQSNAKIVGALFAIMSDQYTNASPPANFLNSVDAAVLITSGIIALIVILFSLFLARSLTKPLKSLTVAVERMQAGDYTQRVDPPNSQDEIGHLSHAFNAMAGTIETDITELKQQDELRRDLIANIAHDLATPLTSVQGFSEALADDVITNAQVRQETAQLIGREIQRLRRLVGDMQNMTSLESGRLQLDLAPLDLYALINETLEVVGFECEQVGIAIRNEMLPTLPSVLADSDRVTQVLLNLLDNARRHTPDGGTITIGAKPENQYLTVWISDTGTGIDPADLPHIFERFYRADRARTTTTGGSGLGLAIVKAIITAQGGTIRAESQPGQGTRIVFTLPISKNNTL
jgi:two-component system sensor histidine kinase BaeS